MTMDANTFDVTTITGRTTLWLDSNRIDECMTYYRNNDIDTLGVNAVRGYTRNDIAFLRAYPFISALTLVSPASGDFELEPVRSLRSLRSLTVSAPLLLPLDEFINLEIVRGVWHSKLTFKGCTRLRVLDISKYNPKSKDLTSLAELPLLRELSLAQSPIVSVNGINRFPALERLDLAYAPKLRDLSGVELLPFLEELHCRNCPKLEHLSRSGILTRLRSLWLNGCASLPSLEFLNGMAGLNEFRFVNTNVLDGDLSPLLRLKWVGFLPKARPRSVRSRSSRSLLAGVQQRYGACATHHREGRHESIRQQHRSRRGDDRAHRRRDARRLVRQRQA